MLFGESDIARERSEWYGVHGLERKLGYHVIIAMLIVQSITAI